MVFVLLGPDTLCLFWIAIVIQEVFFSFLFRQLNIKKVLVTGGTLDHGVDPQVLNENGGEKVAILALDEAGRVSHSVCLPFQPKAGLCLLLWRAWQT